MTDSIEDSDVRRVDSNVDPTALTSGEIEAQLPDDFSRSAKDAFADRVSSERRQVRESVDLSKRITQNPASGEQQLRGPDGRLGPKASRVEGTELTDDGSYNAILEGGERFTVDRVDLQAGATERREASW